MTAPPGIAPEPRPSRSRLARLAVEMAAIYGVFPVALVFVRGTFGRWVIPTLLVTGAALLIALLRDPRFDRRRLGWGPENRPALRAGVRSILRTFLPGGALLAGAVAAFRPDLWLSLPRERTGLWLAVVVLYPLLSVYPQEIIFRTAFFHRYEPLFRDPRWLLAANALAFAVAHLFFANWIAPLLCLGGGWLFGRTYQRSGSTLLAAIEHSLWGDLIFTIGLGWYFYGGSVAATLSQ